MLPDLLRGAGYAAAVVPELLAALRTGTGGDRNSDPRANAHSKPPAASAVAAAAPIAAAAVATAVATAPIAVAAVATRSNPDTGGDTGSNARLH